MDFSNIGKDIASNMTKTNPMETEKIKQLKDINANLSKEIDFAVKQAEDAKKDARFSRRMAWASLAIAIFSAIGTFLPYLSHFIH